MNEYLIFIKNNPVLVLLFIAILVTIIVYEVRLKLAANTELSALQLLHHSNNEQALIIDVRDLADFKKGHIPQSESIPLNELDSRSDHLKNSNKPYIIFYCQTGVRSQDAAKKFVKLGFKNIYQLSGGIDAWLNANLPIKKHK